MRISVDYDLDDLFEDIPLEELQQRIIERYSIGDVLDSYPESAVLTEIGTATMIEYLEDEGYLCFEDKEQMLGHVEAENLLDPYPSEFGIYREDCIQKINEIVSRDGWDYLFNIIENK